MTVNQYLAGVLTAQTLTRTSPEAKAMQGTRATIEAALREKFGDAPKIYWAGSYGKHTMVRRSYDIDIVFYYPHDTTTSVEQINSDVEAALLANPWRVDPQDVSLRLYAKSGEYHIDVVPGRAIDDTFKHAMLWQRRSRSQLQTSVKVHTDAVSARRDIVKLMKLWKLKHGVDLKTFLLELSVLEGVKGKSTTDLEVQMIAALTWLRDQLPGARLVDPANSANVVSTNITATQRFAVSQAARNSLVDAQSDWRLVV